MATVERPEIYAPLFLSLKPITMTFTDRPAEPATLASPPQSPLPFVRPPTPGGGPLSSHPTTPVDIPSGWSPPRDWVTPPKSVATSPTAAPSSRLQRSASTAFRAPLTPASANSQRTQTPRRDTSGVRKLLSLSSLRNSFSSSRTSISLPSPPAHNTISSPLEANYTHGTSTSISTSTSTSTSTSIGMGNQGTKRRPSSPSINSADSRSMQDPPQLRKRKSASWFRRKSGLFLFDGENSELGRVQEAQSRPHSGVQDAPRQSPDAPSLPEFGSLRGGNLTGGALSEDDIFASVGR